MEAPVLAEHEGAAPVPAILVTDPDDARVAPFRHVRERDVAGREGAFIAEGEVVLNVLAGSPIYRARALLLTEKRVERLRPLIERFLAGTPVYAATQAVMDEIAGFPIHRGVLALGERPAPVSTEALLSTLPSDALVLGLFGISNHDNIGGIFRNAAAFGVDAVLIDGACCDPLYRKAIRVSVGGVLTVPFTRLASGEDVIAKLEARCFEVAALSPRGGERLADFRSSGPRAVLFGAEGSGLPPDILDRVHTISIPMAGGFDSLNVATTSGIVLHYLRQPPELHIASKMEP